MSDTTYIESATQALKDAFSKTGSGMGWEVTAGESALGAGGSVVPAYKCTLSVPRGNKSDLHHLETLHGFLVDFKSEAINLGIHIDNSANSGNVHFICVDPKKFAEEKGQQFDERLRMLGHSR